MKWPWITKGYYKRVTRTVVLNKLEKVCDFVHSRVDKPESIAMQSMKCKYSFTIADQIVGIDQNSTF